MKRLEGASGWPLDKRARLHGAQSGGCRVPCAVCMLGMWHMTMCTLCPSPGQHLLMLSQKYTQDVAQPRCVTRRPVPTLPSQALHCIGCSSTSPSVHEAAGSCARHALRAQHLWMAPPAAAAATVVEASTRPRTTSSRRCCSARAAMPRGKGGARQTQTR